MKVFITQPRFRSDQKEENFRSVSRLVERLRLEPSQGDIILVLPELFGGGINMRANQKAESLVVEGGCLCGSIRYRGTGPVTGITICHCRTCRRSSGAPVVAWGGFAVEHFAFTRGIPVRYLSSVNVERSFCGECGTQLTYQRSNAAGTIDVTLASLDDPEAVIPQDHTWVAQRLSWVGLSDGLPSYDRNRSS